MAAVLALAAVLLAGAAVGADSCDTTALSQQCAVPTTCDGVTAFLDCAAALNCQSSMLVTQTIASLQECFSNTGSSGANGGAASIADVNSPQMHSYNGTLYLQAYTDIVFAATKADESVTVTQLTAALGSLDSVATRTDVGRINSSISAAETRLRSEIEETSSIVTEALVPRFENLNTAMSRSFARINASLDTASATIMEVNSTLAQGLERTRAELHAAASTAEAQTSSLSAEVSSYIEGMQEVVEELADKVSSLEQEQSTLAGTVANHNDSFGTIQQQLSAILSKQADFDDFQKAASRGLIPDSPASSCGQVTSKESGIFYFDGGAGGVFQAYCDFLTDGGRWVKVLQYPGQDYAGWKSGSTAAMGDIATRDVVSGFSKLSDTQINGVKSSSQYRVWKFESMCASNNLYVITDNDYDDARIDLGLAENGVHIHCVAPSLEDCDGKWDTDEMRRFDSGGLNVFDTHYSKNYDESCSRFFFGHRGSENRYTCYGQDNTQRCMSAGSSCSCGTVSSYPPHKTLTIWVKPLDESSVILPPGLLPENPAVSCGAALAGGLDISQAYYLRAGEETFRGFCEQQESGGGWLKILHGSGDDYHSAWTSSNARKALGDVSSASVSGLARLSDATINAYLASAAPWVYKFESDCTSYHLFLKTGRTYDDRQFGMNLFSGAVGCLHPNKCNPNDNRVVNTYPDNIDFSGNDCERYFQGHLGTQYPYSCYSQNKRSHNSRCFSAGSSCRCGQGVDHPVHRNLKIFVKPFSEL